VNAHRCCTVAAGDSKREAIATPTTFTRRCRDIAGWIVPSAILALIPKCPACLAAYLAVGTGVGLSIPTATCVRMLLVITCVSSLSLFAAKTVARLYAGRSINLLAPPSDEMMKMKLPWFGRPRYITKYLPGR